jgi:hypothetical protein
VWIGSAVGLVALMSISGGVLLTAPSGPFRTKGNPVSDVAVELTCLNASASSCPIGSTLLFGVTNMPSQAYLEAYAEQQETGERIWYFSPEIETPVFRAATGTQASTRGIRVGPEHTPGTYVVRVLLLQAPLPRAALLAERPSGVVTDARFPLIVVGQ